MSNQIEIKGVVERLFSRSTTSWSAGKLRSNTIGSLTFTAKQLVSEGANVVMLGQWFKHPTYGHQFQAQKIEHNLKMDSEGLALWLQKNRDVRGIGAVKARIIATVFGDSFDETIMDAPDKIAEAARLSDDEIKNLRDVWIKNRQDHELLTWLTAFGLSIHEVDQIRKKYGQGAVDVLRQDPYLIIGEIPRFAFKRVDGIALKTGIPKTHASRIRHGILWCMRSIQNDGHTCIERDILLNTANTLLELDDLNSLEVIQQATDGLIQEGSIIADRIDETEILIDPFLYHCECRLANIFNRTKDCGHPCFTNKKREGLDEIIHRVNSKATELTPEQLQAVQGSTLYPISLISGGAGTGKTFTINTIRQLYSEFDLHVSLCAPTGKAARRLEQTTGSPSQTIHRLLGYNGKEWKYDSKNPLDTDLLVVDEVSMVDSSLAYRLLQAIDPFRTCVVLVGDHNQLPPVGAGNILRDLIETQVLPITILTTVHRFAGVLKKNCGRILEGVVEKGCEDSVKAWQIVDHYHDPLQCQQALLIGFEQILNASNTDIIHGVQILTPQKKRELGTQELNVKLQTLYHRIRHGIEIDPVPEDRKPTLYVHDKVIQMKNDYKLGIMNGSIGQVIEIDPCGDVTVLFDGISTGLAIPRDKQINLELAYALTIHKAQGSEFPFVVLVIHRQHIYMHHRNLFYTGVTRAQRKVIVMGGDPWAVKRCAKEQKVDARKTWLKYALTH